MYNAINIYMKNWYHSMLLNSWAKKMSDFLEKRLETIFYVREPAFQKMKRRYSIHLYD